MLRDEVEDAGVVNLSDLDLQIGFILFREELVGEVEGYVKIANEPLPDGIVENIILGGISDERLSEHIPAVSCKDLFSDVEDMTAD